MKDEFEKFVEKLKQCRSGEKACEWDKKQTFESRSEEVLKEAQELRQAVENKDYENVKEEIGDVMWDCLGLAIIAEDKGLFTVKDIFAYLNEKITRRKPWVFGDKEIKLEDRAKLWEKIKQEEKKGK